MVDLVVAVLLEVVVVLLGVVAVLLEVVVVLLGVVVVLLGVVVVLLEVVVVLLGVAVELLGVVAVQGLADVAKTSLEFGSGSLISLAVVSIFDGKNGEIPSFDNKAAGGTVEVSEAVLKAIQAKARATIAAQTLENVNVLDAQQSAACSISVPFTCNQAREGRYSVPTFLNTFSLSMAPRVLPSSHTRPTYQHPLRLARPVYLPLTAYPCPRFFSHTRSCSHSWWVRATPFVSRIVGGKFVDLAELLPANMAPMSEDEAPRLLLSGHFILADTQKKREKAKIDEIVTWTEAFTIYTAVISAHAPHRWRDRTHYKLLILRTCRQFEGLAWLNYEKALRKNASALRINDWSNIDTQLYSFHTAGSGIRSLARESQPVPICLSWNRGACSSPVYPCRYRQVREPTPLEKMSQSLPYPRPRWQSSGSAENYALLGSCRVDGLQAKFICIACIVRRDMFTCSLPAYRWHGNKVGFGNLLGLKIRACIAMFTKTPGQRRDGRTITMRTIEILCGSASKSHFPASDVKSGIHHKVSTKPVMSAARFGFSFSGKHVPGVDNPIADALMHLVSNGRISSHWLPGLILCPPPYLRGAGSSQLSLADRFMAFQTFWLIACDSKEWFEALNGYREPLPITDRILGLIESHIDPKSFHHMMFLAACCLEYFGFLRSVEFTVVNLAAF
ncbi:predicted protein [Nematostella vectensis]|uniref:Uncharacterized protein n=1 Tax=Nematostella vectensis TaxID=45351 RepID=A7SFI5_NEMVE|nr:predicted protein [Nematostella vectensis]|eukprot:XP_001629569.1 predicted protein [Nematostella vectensis]